MTGHRRDPFSEARRAVARSLHDLPRNVKLWRMVGEMAVKGAQQRLRARSGGATQAMRDLGIPAGPGAPSAPAPARPAAPDAVPDAGGLLPIDGYDDLSASQVRERLASLDAAGRSRVAAHERAHRARTTILDAIARLDAADGRG